MNSPFTLTRRKHAPKFVSVFDSATDMVGATSSFLKGEAFEGVGTSINNELYAKIINNLPDSWKQKLYTLSGRFGATSHELIPEIDAAEIDKWIYKEYPERKYPAIAIGASNGALVHLYTALGIPWLPQTLLIPIDKKQTFPKDEPKRTMEWGLRPGESFLKNNPDWQLHHMMDPNQDRLRVGSIAYFRVKKRKLGKWYKKFIQERLAPGGSLLIADCDQKWPVKKLGDRHFFQFGGMGGTTAEEYYSGSEKITRFLKMQKASVHQWDAPDPDEEAPEAEWGFEPALLQDIREMAKKESIPITKVTFNHPQDTSPLIADLYRWWYPLIDRPDDRLLVESFALQSPTLSLRKGCIPYWLFFNVDPAANKLEDYLKRTKNYDEIYMMILSHGKESMGSTSIDRWERLMNEYSREHDFIGTDTAKYPKDLAVYARYSRELKEKVVPDFPMPEPMKLSAFEHFVKEKKFAAQVEKKDHFTDRD